jgi:hypothetical protein
MDHTLTLSSFHYYYSQWSPQYQHPKQSKRTKIFSTFTIVCFEGNKMRGKKIAKID